MFVLLVPSVSILLDCSLSLRTDTHIYVFPFVLVLSVVHNQPYYGKRVTLIFLLIINSISIVGDLKAEKSGVTRFPPSVVP